MQSYNLFSHTAVFMVWGSTYCSNIKPLEILQKRTIRIVSFGKFDAHSSPLFAKLKVIKLHDRILLYIACFMYQFSNCNLPRAFDSFFTAVNIRHNYFTRLASKSILAWHQNPHLLFQKLERIMLNFISDRYFGSKIWNEIEEPLKTLSFRCFKRELKERSLDKYITNNI